MCFLCDDDHDLEKSGKCRDKKDYLLPSLVEGGVAIVVVLVLVVAFSVYAKAHHTQIEKREVQKEEAVEEPKNRKKTEDKDLEASRGLKERTPSTVNGAQ